MDTVPFFDLVDRLCEALPLEAEQIGVILDVPLTRDRAADTSAAEAYGPVSAHPRYRSIGLRLPDPDIGDDEAVLRIEPTSDEGLDMAAVIARHGNRFSCDVPSPRYAPGSVPRYVVYEKGWGSLSFGVSNDVAGRLIECVLSTRA